MKNNTPIAIMVAAAITSGATYASDSAVINFTSTISASPCTVDSGSVNQTVAIPSVTDVELKQLADAGAATSSLPNQTFDILLKDCGSGINSALVSFAGTSDAAISTDNTVLQNGGTAGNVGVRIMDTAGTTALKFDDSNFLTFPITGFQDNTLSFYAGLTAKPLTVITAGTVTASATATITYN
ncbi:TPA: fimbrial protein [Aeromonas veronii]